MDMKVNRLAICFVFLFVSITKGLEYNLEQQEGYSFDDAVRYLMYSYSAYCDPSTIQSWSCYWCDYVEGIPPVDVQYVFTNATFNALGFAGVTNDSIIFSFRGTEMLSLKNWIVDLSSAILVPYDNSEFQGCNVANGFYTDYQSVQSQVIQAAKELKSNYPNLPFVFVGHSLGAALSLLGLADLYATLQEPASNLYAWNYGDPRVGDYCFSNTMKGIVGTSYRTVNQLDMVPHLPMEALGFYHTWTEVWFPNSTDVYVVCNGGEDPNCSDSVIGISILDHLGYLGFEFADGLEYCH